VSGLDTFISNPSLINIIISSASLLCVGFGGCWCFGRRRCCIGHMSTCNWIGAACCYISLLVDFCNYFIWPSIVYSYRSSALVSYYIEKLIVRWYFLFVFDVATTLFGSSALLNHIEFEDCFISSTQLKATIEFSLKLCVGVLPWSLFSMWLQYRFFRLIFYLKLLILIGEIVHYHAGHCMLGGWIPRGGTQALLWICGIEQS